MSNTEQPPQPAPADAISINFRDQHNNEVTFKLKGTTKLGKAFDAFSARVERETAQLRFIFEGTRLLADQTVANYDIQDGDTIDVHMEQIGGSFPITKDVDQEWVLVSSEDDQASAQRLQEENEALKDRLTSLERAQTVFMLDANRRGSKIQLHFYDHRNVKVTFKLSNTTRLRRAIEMYADRVCVPAEKIEFRWNSYEVKGEMSPFQIGMKHNDRVDCTYDCLY